jgi:hypothetical protein
MVNDELKRMWKKAFVAQFKVLSQHLPRGTEKNHEKPQIARPNFEHRTYQI